MSHGKMRKWILPLLLVLSLLLPVTIFAKQTGSLLLKNMNHDVILYRVADGNNQPEADFTDAKVDLQDTAKAVTNARKLQKYAIENSIPGDSKTPDASKQVLFTSLEKGCYLVCSQAAPEEFVPFFMWIPTALGDEIVYDVQAEPKTEEPTDPVVPTESAPSEPNIPQTGNLLWPQYVLLGLGFAVMIWGMAEVIRGRRKQDE